MAVTTKYTINDLISEYNVLVANMISASSLRSDYESKLLMLFNKFGFDNNQKAQVMAQFFTSSYQTDMAEISKLVISSLESQSNSSKKNADCQLVMASKKEVLEKAKVTKAEASRIMQEIEKIKADTSSSLISSAVQQKQIDVDNTKIALMAAQTLSEKQKANLTQYQYKLIDQQALSEAMNTKKIKREIYAVDEALKVKKAEFLSQVTSFAVNSDGASGAQTLIASLNTAIDSLSPSSSAATIIDETTNITTVANPSAVSSVTFTANDFTSPSKDSAVSAPADITADSCPTV